jgi:hypothetical protein
MAKASISLRIAKNVVDRKARVAIEQAVAAQRERGERMARERAAVLSARGDDLAAVLKPVADLVNADPEAVKAIARLRSEIGKGRLTVSETGRPSRATPVAISFILGEQFSLRVPPYDFEFNWGNDRQHSANKAAGYAGVIGDSGSVGGGESGDVATGCGVGVAFQADAGGQAVVRTQVQYTWEYLLDAFGIGSSAHGQGGIDISAWQGTTLVAGARRVQGFSDAVTTGGERKNSGTGSVALPDLEIRIPVAASTWYVVNVGVWVECSHSTGLGASRAQGKVEATVGCVVFDRTP